VGGYPAGSVSQDTDGQVAYHVCLPHRIVMLVVGLKGMTKMWTIAMDHDTQYVFTPFHDQPHLSASAHASAAANS